MSAVTSKPPYHEIFQSLLESVMRAQAEVVTAWERGISPANFDHEMVNRHFAWLALEYREGTNRHLFEGAEGLQPLRTKGLRGRDAIPERLAFLLRDRSPLPHSSDTALRSDERAFMRQKKKDAVPLARPTRISRLVATSLIRGVRERDVADQESEEAKRPYLLIRSPLAIVFDFLTAPTMLGSRAYALLTIRNFLFETFNIFPENVGDLERAERFTVAQMESALSHIWTSFRQRHNSKGWDPINAEGRGSSGGLLRHYLAARGILWMRFRTVGHCLEYLEGPQIRPPEPKFEFARSDHLEKLPELGELINELWGLPVPMRGADTVFRGGLKFSSRGGLILGLHGGAGAGKTSLALALGAFLAPLGVKTLFLTGEECAQDLESKAQMLIPDELRRLSFFPRGRSKAWLNIQFLDQADFGDGEGLLEKLERELEILSRALEEGSEPLQGELGAPKPCRAVIVLDQIHDILLAASDQGDHDSNTAVINRLRKFVLTCRDLRALVILTAGEDWSGSRAFDYLVDVAISLSQEAVEEYGQKPDRQVILTKARHQLCSIGSHGFQIAGSKGVRISPQINYQLDRRAIWRTRLPEMNLSKKVLSHAWSLRDYEALMRSDVTGRMPPSIEFQGSPNGVKLYRGANIFLNGEGSGAKAALALKIAMAPTFSDDGDQLDQVEKVLVVSFLYPEEYYIRIRESIWRLARLEYGDEPNIKPHIEVIHLYPGNYRPDRLFNRIEWELDAAELLGEPYTSVVIDGLHNVFLQFPQIEKYRLFWPQLYSSLRTRPLTIVSTHTTFVIQGAREGEQYRLDDLRTEPLRHALVQKTDFRFEIDPLSPQEAAKYGLRRGEGAAPNIFKIKPVAAINQPIPPDDMLWSRDHLVLFESAQGTLQLELDPMSRHAADTQLR